MAFLIVILYAVISFSPSTFGVDDYDDADNYDYTDNYAYANDYDDTDDYDGDYSDDNDYDDADDCSDEYDYIICSKTGERVYFNGPCDDDDYSNGEYCDNEYCDDEYCEDEYCGVERYNDEYCEYCDDEYCDGEYCGEEDYNNYYYYDPYNGEPYDDELYDIDAVEMVLRSYGAHEVVLLFDTSSAMGLIDPEFLAPDALRQIKGSLPSYWHVGLVTFSSDIVDVVPPGTADTRAEINAVLRNINYTASANHGAGLLRATELFSENAISRTIIFLSGNHAAESDMQLTEQAVAQIIANDIQMHMIAVGNSIENFCEVILALPQATGGRMFLHIPADRLNQAAYSLTFDVFDIARTPLTRNSAGRFTAHLPAEGIDFARILITTEAELDNLVVSVESYCVTIQTGQRFAVIEILDPLSQTIDIEFTYAGNSSAYLILEWDLQLMTVTGNDGLPRYWFVDWSGQNVFFNPFFSEAFFPLYLDGTELRPCSETGHLVWDIGPEDALSILRSHFWHFGINLPVSAELPPRYIAPPPVVPDDENVGMRLLSLIALIVAVVAIIVLIILGRSDKKQDEDASEEPDAFAPPDEPAVQDAPVAATTAPPTEPAPEPAVSAAVPAPEPVAPAEPEPAPAAPAAPVAPVAPVVVPVVSDDNAKFAGTLDLYVAIHSDNPISSPTPKKFRLSRRGEKQEALLQDILKKCKFSNAFPGSDKICFSADEQGALQIINGTGCKVLVGTDMLAEEQRYTLQQGEIVHVRDRYGASELVISPNFK